MIKTIRVLSALWVLTGVAAAQVVINITPGDDLAAAVRAARGRAKPVTIELAAGVHVLPATLSLTPADSGLRFVNAPGAAPVLSGARLIGGWQVRDGVWEVTLPEVVANDWRPRQLFVGGRRATPCRSPNAGYYQTAAFVGENERRAFRYNPGELAAWPDLADALVKVLHSWESSLLPIANVDEATQIVTFAGDAQWKFGYWNTPNRWFIEGVEAAFDAPGEWHLNRRTGLLRYRPLPGESPAETPVYAPHLSTLVALRGEPRLGMPVAGVSFEGITFAHVDDTLPPTGRSDAQAASTVDGAVELLGARNCSFVRCRFEHVGGYALAIRRGSRDCSAEQCEFVDTGAGAVRIGETVVPGNEYDRCLGHRIENNWVHDYNRIYAGGVGVWLAHAGDCTIAHNDISDGTYTGISVGWDWSVGPTDSKNNRINYNHIHHIVNGQMSDSGGIYTLGNLTGTELIGNVIHDQFSYEYPDYGWGIYLDAQSHGVTVRDNVVYAVEDGLMLHNGSFDNVVSNNVFAQAVDWLVWRSPNSITKPNTFTNNVFVVTQGELFYQDAEPDTLSRVDNNIYWRTDGLALLFMEDDFARWQARGLDTNSVIRDPGLALPVPRGQIGTEWTDIGFKPFDTRQAGLTGDPAWVAGPSAIPRAPTVMRASHVQAFPDRIEEDFEATAPGNWPSTLAGDLGLTADHGVVVSDQRAAQGQRSLRFSDAPGIEFPWQPHAYWTLRARHGVARFTCRLWVGPGATPWMEWRTPGQPFKGGPSLQFTADRQLVANGTTVASFAEGTWLTLQITCPLGDQAKGTYLLDLGEGDGPLRDLGEQRCDAEFDVLGWLGFVSLGESQSEFYLDDVSLTVTP